MAEAVMLLCSDKAGFITDENLCSDDGRTKRMVCHGNKEWTPE